MHESHLSVVEENVLYNVRGANYYVEDGNEMHNRFMYNVGICPYSLAGPMQGCTIPGTDNDQADTGLNQAGIWSLAHANDFVGNRMANSYNGLLWQSQGRENSRGAALNRVCTAHVPFGRVIGNTNHGHGRFGLYFLVKVYPLRLTQTLADNGFVEMDTCNEWGPDGADRGKIAVMINNTDVRASPPIPPFHMYSLHSLDWVIQSLAGRTFAKSCSNCVT